MAKKKNQKNNRKKPNKPETAETKNTGIKPDAAENTAKKETPVTDSENNKPETVSETESAQTPEQAQAVSEQTTTEPPPPKKKKKRFTFKNELQAILLSLAIGFTVCFFTPMDTFLGNQRDVGVAAGNIIKLLLAASGVVSFVSFAILNLMLAIHKRAFRFTSSIFLGILLAMYSQMMFMNGRMVKITGDATTYAEKSSENITNMVIFCIIALIPTIIYIIMLCNKKSSFTKLLRGRAVPYMSAVLIVMQSFGTFSQYQKNGIMKVDESKYNKFLSYVDSFNFSKDKNVLVILADRLDSVWMNNLLEEYPDLNELLDGFTFYPNNVSCYTNTFPSLPQMLTNNMYDDSEWSEYISKSWAGNTITRKLHDNGYKTSLVIDNLTTFETYEQIADQCDNIRTDGEYAEINYTGEGGILPTFMDFSLGKLSPYLLKAKFLDGYTSDFSNKFTTANNNIPGRHPGGIGVDSDYGIYEYIKEYGVDNSCDRNMFSFVHMSFAHDNDKRVASIYDGYDNSDPDASPSLHETIRGSWEILATLFDKMKEKDVYDNTTIIVIADHGHPPAEIEIYEEDRLDSPNVASLLIKPAGAERGPLKINSEAELSNEYFPASVIEYAGLPHDDFGTSYNDVMNMDTYPDRFFHVYFFHSARDVENFMTYKINGDALDLENWKIIERHGEPADD